MIGYLAILVGALTLGHNSTVALFVIGGAAVLLLFIGIHNAWDPVTYVAADRILRSDERGEASGPASGSSPEPSPVPAPTSAGDDRPVV